ncbi:MAG: MFS domain-containing histidine kinase [Bacteroidota bacterium]
MSRTVVHAFNPFERHLSFDRRALRTLRLALLLCAVLIPVFGVALHQSDAGYVDPWWLRVGWMVLALCLLAGTFWTERLRAWSLSILTLYICGMIGWIGGLVYINDLQPEIAVGFLFTYVAGCILTAFVSDRMRVHTALVVAGGAFAVAFTFAVSDPQTDPVVYALCIVSAGITLLIASYAWSSAQGELLDREETLNEAERLGQIGSWSHDLTTGRRKWSNGMYRLVGEAPREGDPPTLFDYVSDGYRATVLRDERKMLDGEAPGADHTYAIVRADGVERQVHSIVRLVRSAEGEAERMIGVVIDVTVEAEHTRGLMEARKAAEQAATLQSAILANMSHEIRTPLTAVIGFAQLLREETGDELLDLIEPIETSGERLLETLSSLLNLARTEAERLDLDAVPFDLVTEVRTIVAMWDRRAQARDLTLRLDAPEASLQVLAAPRELRSALSHLVSNAMKFTTDGGVTVRVTPEAETARVDVIDSGQGIDPEFLPRLFEPFWQESLGSARKHEGSGLGLAVARRFIEAMDGTIGVESTVGEGTTFTVRLPLATLQPPAEARPLADAPRDAPPEGGAWVSRPDSRSSDGRPPGPRPAGRQAVAARETASAPEEADA